MRPDTSETSSLEPLLSRGYLALLQGQPNVFALLSAMCEHLSSVQSVTLPPFTPHAANNGAMETTGISFGSTWPLNRRAVGQTPQIIAQLDPVSRLCHPILLPGKAAGFVCQRGTIPRPKPRPKPRPRPSLYTNQNPSTVSQSYRSSGIGRFQVFSVL